MPGPRSAVDVGLARSLRVEGLTLTEIGARFGVSHQRVRQLLGKTVRGGQKPKPPASRRRVIRVSALPILCKNNDCTGRANCHGFCKRCYDRWLFHNSADRRASLAARGAEYQRRMWADQTEKGVRFRRLQREATDRWKEKTAHQERQLAPCRFGCGAEELYRLQGLRCQECPGLDT